MNEEIAKFEDGLKKLCEFYRDKMPLAALAGTLDNVKVMVQYETIRNFSEPEIVAPVQELGPIEDGSPLPEEAANG
jgi:hypothetical protein